MPLRLYINQQQVDLEAGQVIAQTKQVNDLNSLDNRQAGYTNRFKLPKTARNIKVMQFLSLPGNRAVIPYQKNECSLYSETGECFVFNGHAVITDGGGSYEVVIYDGIIDLYKAIENMPLSAVGLEELNHTKSVTAVKATWDAANPPYRYILADYNGATGPVNDPIPGVNIDYLVPSVNVKYLWDKIFNLFGFTYSGSVFDTERFKNLWITFPKGMSTGESQTEIFANEEAGFLGENSGNSIMDYYISYPSYNADEENLVVVLNRHLMVMQPGYYRLGVTGNLNARNLLGIPCRSKVYVGKNSNNLPPVAVQQVGLIKDNIQPETEFEGTYTLYLGAYESVCVLATKASLQGPGNGYSIEYPSPLNVNMVKVSENDYNFPEAMADLSIRDFLTEIVHRFGLTLFKDKYSSHYDFLTLGEQLQSAEVLDWSKKLGKKLSENYVYGSYARRNWFRYQYNDKESNHCDSYMDVANVNLPDAKDVIKSKIYAPEKVKSIYLSRLTNVYKLWDKEAVENPAEGEASVTYKPLDKRYYLLRAEYAPKIVLLSSDELQTGLLNAGCWVEQYWKLSFSDIISDYYSPLQQVLRNSLMVTAEFLLDDQEVANFDFRKLIYVEQLSSYFIMNKILNYVPGKPVRCELVRIDYSSDIAAAPPPLAISKVVVDNYDIRVHFSLDLMVSSATLQIYGYGTPNAWSSWPGNVASPRHAGFTTAGTFRIRMQAGNEVSNEVEITVGNGSYVVEVP